jgi:cytochrome c-type protein NapC
MNPELQKTRSRKMHELGAKDGSTCITCHKGIAHHKPQGMTDADEE